MLAALMQIYSRSPEAVLSACFESLSSGTGELYDAAFEALQSFLPNHDRSLTSPKAEDPEPIALWTDERRVADWLAPAVQKMKGISFEPAFTSRQAQNVHRAHFTSTRGMRIHMHILSEQ